MYVAVHQFDKYEFIDELSYKLEVEMAHREQMRINSLASEVDEQREVPNTKEPWVRKNFYPELEAELKEEQRGQYGDYQSTRKRFILSLRRYLYIAGLTYEAEAMTQHMTDPNVLSESKKDFRNRLLEMKTRLSSGALPKKDLMRLLKKLMVLEYDAKFSKSGLITD